MEFPSSPQNIDTTAIMATTQLLLIFYPSSDISTHPEWVLPIQMMGGCVSTSSLATLFAMQTSYDKSYMLSLEFN